FATMEIHYDPQQQHLNVGLPPQCKDGGYFIFITLNKEELDPAHNYADQLFADQFIWVTRRDVTEDHKGYVNLRLPETRVSLFVRTTPREDFVYAGNSTTSTRRSPASIFETNDGGRLSFFATWTCVSPASALACFNLSKNDL